MLNTKSKLLIKVTSARKLSSGQLKGVLIKFMSINFVPPRGQHAEAIIVSEQVAEFLQTHPKVAKVYYPGLESDPGHEVAKSQLKAFSGMLGFEMKNKPDFFQHMKLCSPWVSLGDVASLCIPYGASLRRGIPDNYVRMSIGVEDPDDIIADLKQAMDKS
jgi:cystathionine beta-lyase/cystathionine gamma-synthase